ncbi:hypothetical protein PG991_012032 [Apiospora marii]|uniref:Xylanolytic transcriptional activator regulatory domain-containing protein n=1 Tax=Apiospora marii TaxID=335849 RepID=A0ABR1RHY2_9PEZI
MHSRPSGSVTASGRPRRRAAEACTFCRKRKVGRLAFSTKSVHRIRRGGHRIPHKKLTHPRQMKCNNEQPTCANCRTYGKDCTYEPLTASHLTQHAASSEPRRISQHIRQRKVRAAAISADQAQIESNPPRVEVGSPAFEGNRDTDAVPSSVLPKDPNPSGCQPPDNGRDPSSQPKPPASSGTYRPGVSRMVVSANGISSYHGRTSTLFEETIQERTSAAESRPSMPDEWTEKGLVAEAAKQGQLEEFNHRAGTLDFDGVDPELGMHLLSLHWNRQHHSFLITYRPAFMRDMACGGPYFSKILLNAIYFGASKFSPRREVRRDPDDVRTAGWQFRERVRTLLGSALDRSEITTIQALLVMTNSLFALGDERSAAWLYAGLAFRMIIDLGMHVDAPDLSGSPRKFSDEDVEIRRRVFWGAFVVDKIQSLYQGRPATLRESDTAVPIKFLDTYEEFQNWQPFAYSVKSTQYSGSPAYSVSTFTSLCRLSVVMSDILSCIYTERTFDRNASDLCAVLESLNSKLAAWKDALPAHLTFDPAKSTQVPPPHVLSLHAMYHVLSILLHRPFVADGHLYNTSRSIPVNSFLICASAADSISALLRVYDRTFSVRHAPYLISYATYVAATIHVRIAARRNAASEARENLQTCLGVFRDNEKTNWAVRRAKSIVQSLIKRLGVNLSEIRDDPGGPAPTQVRPRSPCHDGQVPGFDNRSSDAITASTTSTNIQVLSGNSNSPSAGWYDIDGIIQSFVRGQNGNYADDAGASSQVENYQMPHEATSGVVPEARDFSGSIGVDGNPASWVGFLPGGGASGAATASFDDLLFGFNGSALDSSFY